MNLTPTLAAELAALALGGLHREYPNRIGHLLTSDADVRAPRELTPAFFGCFDWHSAVHGHWMLARLVRLFPTEPFASEARAALDVSFTPERIHGELEYLMRDGRARFELPYGMGWLLTLGAELRRFEHDDDALRWRDVLAPLMELGFDRLARYAAALGKPGIRLSSAAMAQLQAAPWPGNIRQLKNIIERIYISDEDGTINASELPIEITSVEPIRGNFYEKVRAYEINLLLNSLKDFDGNQRAAAENLGMSYDQFRHFYKKYKLEDYLV